MQCRFVCLYECCVCVLCVYVDALFVGCLWVVCVCVVFVYTLCGYVMVCLHTSDPLALRHQLCGARLSASGFCWTHLGEVSMVTLHFKTIVVFCFISCGCGQMRVLRSDFARYNLAEDDEGDVDQEDIGWKVVQSDVFRFPPHKSLLCAVLGEQMGVYGLTCRGVVSHAGVWSRMQGCGLDVHTHVHTTIKHSKVM